MNQPSAGSASSGRTTATRILLLSVWFGIFTGLVEGALLLSFRELGWLHWLKIPRGVSFEIIWIAALVNLVFFLAAGFVPALGAWWLPRLPWSQVAVWLFGFLAVADWFLISGTLRRYAIVVLSMGLATAFLRWYRRTRRAADHFWRKSLPWVIGTALLVAVATQGSKWIAERIAIAKLPAVASGKPNILVVVLDSVRPDHLSAYGYGRETSPALDRLAREGVLFEQAIAPSCWSPPSHASLVTGRYLYEHRAEWDTPLDGRFPTIAEALRRQGYRTGAFSGNVWWFEPTYGVGRGFIRFDVRYFSLQDVLVHTVYGAEWMRLRLFRRTFGFQNTRKWGYYVTADALRWIDRDPKVPFFMMVNYNDAHSSYFPPPPFRNKFTKKPRTSAIIQDDHGSPKHDSMTPEEVQSEIDGYDGAIAYADDHLGRLLAALDQRGYGDNLLVVVTADHGQSFGEHGYFIHRNGLYREVLRVPLVVWWPGKVPSGVRIVRPASICWIPATVMDLLGTGSSELFPGPSLRTGWENPTEQTRWPFPLAEVRQQPFKWMRKLPVFRGWMRSVVTPRWHYIVHEKEGAELYDWVSDPAETKNLAATPEGATVCEDLAKMLPGKLISR